MTTTTPATSPARRPSLRERTSLRTQLVVTVVVLAALAVVSVAAASALVLRGYLYDRIDSQLWQSLRPLTQSGAQYGDGMMHGGGMHDDSDDFTPPSIYFGQVYDANGTVIGTLGSALPSQVAAPSLPRLDAQTLGDIAGEPFTVRSDEGHRWRVLVLAARNDQVPAVAAIAVGVPLADMEQTIGRLVLVDLVVALVVLLLLAVVARWAIKANLRPLAEVETTAAAIADGDLTQRVPERDPRTEVGRLTGALNTMLARIEELFAARQESEAQARESEERMRRFVADASHELRTPLTTIRGFAELYRQGAVTDPAQAADAMRRIEDAASRMGLLVDDLLLLARLDQQRPLSLDPVDLLAVATDAVHDVRVLSDNHPVTVVPLDGPPPLVAGDAQRLRQVTTNLLANAVRHTPAGTRVTVTVGVAPEDPAHAVLEVRDDGPGLAPEDAERVFERFYRADASRTRTSAAPEGGTGLGLAIVAALVAAHGGTVAVETRPGEGAAFRVRLPLLTR